jgi:hypothetical protein
LRLFRRGIWDDDAAFGLELLLEPPNDDAIMERTKFHGFPPEMTGIRV